MSKTTQEIFLMIAYYTRDRFREHARIGMPITTSTDCESLVVLVGNLINQLNLGSKMVCISNDGRTNLARCRDILESTFENTGVFDSENPMYVMECLADVLANACKAGVMGVKYDDGRVDTEVTGSAWCCEWCCYLL